MNRNKIELLGKCKGFTEDEINWVQIKSLRSDVLELSQELLQETEGAGTKRQRIIIDAIFNK